MKRILNLFICTLFIFVGCSEKGKLNMNSEIKNSIEKALLYPNGDFQQMNWRQQLAYGRDSMPSVLIENGIKFLDYSEKYVLHSQEQIIELKQSF